MRRIAITASLAFVAAAAASATFAAPGDPAKHPQPRPTYGDVSARTLRATSERFSIDVTIIKNLQSTTLHINGASGPGKLQVRLRLVDETPGDKPRTPPVTGAAVIDGPFLYERAPSGLVVGKKQWLRQRLADLGRSSDELRMIRGLTARSLLTMLDVTRIRATPDNFVYAGWLKYDDPAVRRGLGSLTGDVQFRGIHALVLAGRDGRVHRIRINGRTPDGHANLLLLAHIYAFDRPVHLKVPSQDQFLDPKNELLSN